MIGRTLSHYRIVEKIGAGGMGEVYRARDEHLGRDVALKVLPAGTLGDEHARKLFRKEAQALSKLNHPNIATVHDFDTQDGVDFLVMELVEGVTLSDKLAVGPLGEKEVARLGSQVAEALEEAHERGVVHRDLKPGNVMVTAKGQVKVLDFGLAKLVQPVTGTATTESFTETQAAAGTLPYMAPEQLRGEKVDARSDIYAAGAVLYEMATGQRPFPETPGPRLIDAILHQAPQPPSGLNRRVSPGLENIILKALEKEPENRYQSAKEIGVDLRRLGMPGSATAVLSARRPARRRRMVWAAGVALVALLAVLVGLNVAGLRERLLGGPAVGQITSLVVLPLENLMGDTEQDYFVDGMHDELIANLAKIGALTVISRTSAMRYKGTDKSLPEIARELGVDAVIEGTVRRAGNQVRITVQLIEAATDKHLFAKSYQRELRDVLALQSDVARAIAGEIQVSVTSEEKTGLARSRQVNPHVYELYLRGEHFLRRESTADAKKAIEYFRQAADQDPGFAPAYAGLAESYVVLALWGGAPPAEVFATAKAAAMKALELDDLLPEAHLAAAGISIDFDWDWAAAEREIQRALELSPASSAAHGYYGYYLECMGRFDEAIAHRQHELELDPFSPAANQGLAFTYIRARRYREAIEQLKKALELYPNDYQAHWMLSWVYALMGAHQEARHYADKALALSPSPDDTVLLAVVGWVYGVTGMRSEASRLLSQLSRLATQAYVDPIFPATVVVGLGDKDRAIELIRSSVTQRSPAVARLKVEPMWDPLRDDPRFQSLLRRLNFPE